MFVFYLYKCFISRFIFIFIVIVLVIYLVMQLFNILSFNIEIYIQW